MMYIFRFSAAILLTLLSHAAGADTHSIQHEIEVFLSTGVGTFVFILLSLLFLLWLLLPLAVFGLKSRLKTLIRESRETNSILADIRNELAAIEAENSDMDTNVSPAKTTDRQNPQELYEEIRFDP
ncbi:MAG: hypothetical protein KJO91_01850 [Gammaproteobacteria bacterium]|nr:hypothetical protein [Gammaproteobacteria bacterium]